MTERKERAKNAPGIPFKPGNPGRPKGSKNKLSATAKENIVWVFDEMGGAQAYADWAAKNDRNRGVFYTQVYPKLLPLDIAHSGAVDNSGTLTVRVVHVKPNKGNGSNGGDK